MRTKATGAVAFFFAGFFAKDVIDAIFFLAIDKYPIEIFGFQITAASHKIMLVVSLILTAVFLYYGSMQSRGINQRKANG